MAGEVITAEAQNQETYIWELTERINGQLLEIAELHRKNTDIYKEIGVLQKELAEKDELLVTLREEKEQLEAECGQKAKITAEWKNKAENLEEEKRQLLLEIEAYALREKKLAEHISAMENSRSWKVTKPLRALKRLSGKE